MPLPRLANSTPSSYLLIKQLVAVAVSCACLRLQVVYVADGMPSWLLLLLLLLETWLSKQVFTACYCCLPFLPAGGVCC
jgi:hypothetical protein